MSKFFIAAATALALLLSACGTTQPPPPECKGTARAVNPLPTSQAALSCTGSMA